MRTSKMLVPALALCGATACHESTAPPQVVNPLVGTFAALANYGRAFPFVYMQAGDSTFEATGDLLTLNADSTVFEVYDSYVSTNGTIVRRGTSQFSGVYGSIQLRRTRLLHLSFTAPTFASRNLTASPNADTPRDGFGSTYVRTH